MSWFEDMAAAMKRRELAVNGRDRWQAKVDEAEVEIAELAKQQNSYKPAEHDGAVVAQEIKAAPLAPEYSDSAE